MSKPTSPRHFVLPDLLSLCPFQPMTNTHYIRGAAESRAWINAYDVFTDKKRAFFVQGCNELLVSYTYPYAGYETFRTCCDFVNLLFVVDEVSDEQNGADARHTGEISLNVMRNPSWDDGSKLAKMTREFRARLAEHAGPGCMRRFLKHFEDYIDAVAQEAEYRERGEVLDMVSFEALRRENSAIRLCFGLFEVCFGVDLADEVFNDPTFMTLYWAAADMVCWSNDVYSYNMEQERGIAGNNIVTVLMHDKGVDLQTAADLVGEHFKTLMARFVEAKTRLPSWGPAADETVQKYVEAMEHWVTGNLEWSFETQRYFGPLHKQIKKTRIVSLRPREEPEDEDD